MFQANVRNSDTEDTVLKLCIGFRVVVNLFCEFINLDPKYKQIGFFQSGTQSFFVFRANGRISEIENLIRKLRFLNFAEPF